MSVTGGQFWFCATTKLSKHSILPSTSRSTRLRGKPIVRFGSPAINNCSVLTSSFRRAHHSRRSADPSEVQHPLQSNACGLKNRQTRQRYFRSFTDNL